MLTFSILNHNSKTQPKFKKKMPYKMPFWGNHPSLEVSYVNIGAVLLSKKSSQEKKIIIEKPTHSLLCKESNNWFVLHMYVIRTSLLCSYGEAVWGDVKRDESQQSGYGCISVYRQQRSATVSQQTHHSRRWMWVYDTAA